MPVIPFAIAVVSIAILRYALGIAAAPFEWAILVTATQSASRATESVTQPWLIPVFGFLAYPLGIIVAALPQLLELFSPFLFHTPNVVPHFDSAEPATWLAASRALAIVFVPIHVITSAIIGGVIAVGVSVVNSISGRYA